MMSQGNASEQKMKREIKFIYETLLKHGFPGFLNNNIARDEKEMGLVLEEYLQPNPRREALIQWLILQLCPLMDTSKDRKGGKIKKFVSCLWRLGVMPFSRHTKNLDYQKYVQGLIGKQNSINLLFNLTLLLTESFQVMKARTDSQFPHFLDDLYKNYDGLINLDYDPYNVSFPPAYNHLSQEQFEQQYNHFKQKIERLRVEQLKNEERQKEYENRFENMVAEFQENKSTFLRTFDILKQKMKSAIDSHASLLDSWKKDSQTEIQGRIMSISTELPSLYHQYKEKTRVVRMEEVQGRQVEDVRQLILTLNDRAQL